ncbi:MAG TPA: hypothetical protein VEX68_13505 [Bryobacteraceae bacterium]|nr:hypothetical protein [Bryobacteraceae bacterium]
MHQIEQLRTEHNLRALASAEEGLGLGKLPVRVFGFSYAPATETPLFARKSYHSFEIHKLADGRAFLLAFVTAADSDRIRSHKEEVDVTVYPEPYEDARTLVRIHSTVS